jgi:hypothetical protein
LVEASTSWREKNNLIHSVEVRSRRDRDLGRFQAVQPRE